MGTGARDPFVAAWGEIDAWRGTAHQGRLIAGWSPALTHWDPVGVLGAARALGQATALRLHLLEHTDRLAPTLRLPYLHRAYAALRRRGGPASWRRYWLGRAVSLSSGVAQEQQDLVLARSRLSAWHRAVALAQEGVQQALDHPWNSDAPRPVDAALDWEQLQQGLASAAESLGQLQRNLEALMHGTDRLQRKADLIAELGQTVPDENGDVLHSPWLSGLVDRALGLPSSGVLGSRE